MTAGISWPGGKQFAFSVFDDTDLSAPGNFEAVYDLLASLGMRTTKSVWPATGSDLQPRSAHGSTCDDPEYLRTVLQLQQAGFEIGYHNSYFEGLPRDLIQEALERFNALFGAYPIAHGTVRLDGREVRFATVDDAMSAGLAFVPEDRDSSAFIGMDLRENLSAANVSQYWNGLFLRQRQEARDARQTMAEFSLKARSEHQSFATLSGGNQQKAVVARWLRRKPKVLLLDEPTQGVDIGARGEIYRLVRRAVAAGSSVIVVTSDFEELARVADRVLVLDGGRLTAELRPPDIEPSRITQLVLSGSGARSPMEVNPS